MELRLDSITASSKVMLVAYPLFSAAIGLSYLLGDPHRTSSASFAAVRDVMPMSSWGWVFIGLTALKVAAWITRRRKVMVLALCIGLGVYSCWAFGFVASWMVDEAAPGPPMASFNAIWVWSFVAVAHVASLQSLTKDS